jgi:glycosyltransferase involved in cell wall biosynthesis
MQPPISAVIITKNEEHNIARCVRSLAWADEILVLDSGSTDRTMEIAREMGCRVLETPWLGFGKTKQGAVSAATNDWIFSIDADEEVTPELAEAIQELDLENGGFVGYKAHWQTIYLGKKLDAWIRKASCRLCLFDRRHANFNTKIVHEGVETDLPVRYLPRRLVVNHYMCNDIKRHVEKIALYHDLEALKAIERGGRSSVSKAIFRASWDFFRIYFFQGIFLRGRVGFVYTAIHSFGRLCSYLRRWELLNTRK